MTKRDHDLNKKTRKNAKPIKCGKALTLPMENCNHAKPQLFRNATNATSKWTGADGHTTDETQFQGEPTGAKQEEEEEEEEETGTLCWLYDDAKAHLVSEIRRNQHID